MTAAKGQVGTHTPAGRERNARAASKRNQRRKAAVYAQRERDDIRGQLVKCLWQRIVCARCGEYDVATSDAEPLPDGWFKCAHCKRKLAAVQQTCKGQTTHILPWHSGPRPLMASYVKIALGMRDKERKPKSKAAKAGGE